MADRRLAPRTALSSLTRRPRAVLAPPRPAEQPGSVPATERRSRMVDNAVYAAGRRIATPESVAESHEWLTEGFDDRMVWLGLYRPEPAELGELAEQYDLPDLAVEDAIHAHQRPKFERYGDTLFVVLKAARYLDEAEEVEFGELHLFLGSDFAITVRHSESPDLARVRRRLESSPELLARGTEAVLYAILDAVVDGYAPVVAGLDKDIDEIEVEVFRGDPQVSRRIYELSQEVVDFQRAVQPLTGILAAITAGFEKYGVDEELRSHLRDVADHVTQITERVEGFRLQLRDILTVNATLVAQRQNEEMKTLTETSIAQGEEVKKISAWAAILFAPSLVGGVYGMNFENMPETDWYYGYPFAVVLMFMVSLTLYVIFKRRDWI
ncbi:MULTISPECIES: magnesium/cobalt transporter CorA [unclassified Modestobacter]|uniref:magnesium/cobalt transporter CorA n=1 Tax=unclassified Modestobacter TaxID=2643866 RepID=UPI0022AAC4F7|nr:MULTISPECIES: magnesium/cobalt transporter CorA [unclassified Modestobacter]MCZ2824224.1 magnesium/cobalt transporter CorA [Modestobacter sp. VKM Ac-2981]MCZ2854248.1 magnesium/cobalt transporter CorA [Modestobacter sp. VKM Ac-2982]